MRFTVREGTDPVAGADRALLAAMGMPGGGAVAVGDSHVLVLPREVKEPTAILLGDVSRLNAGVRPGDVVDVRRSMLGAAERVVLDGLPAPSRALVRALQGRPLTVGDRVIVEAAYLEESEDPVTAAVVAMEPAAAVVGASTVFVQGDATALTSEPPMSDSDVGEQTEPETIVESGPRPPTTTEALLAGLDNELDVMAGWLALLTSSEDLPSAWGLPQVAGVVIEGPAGCGKAELVEAAANRANARVHEIDLNLIFKPERLLDVLEKATKNTLPPTVIYVDPLEVVAGEEGLAPYRTQVAAIMRWFLDAIADRKGLACVLGVASTSHLDPTLTRSELLPRTLTVPPPDLDRRRMLFEAALAKVPSDGLEFDVLAARTAGFSGADIVATVVHGSAMTAGSGDPLTTESMLQAIEGTPPSLGSVPMGEMPNYGFDKVANLTEVKQRLTEAVIWPMTEPERFTSMGIDPPRGILLYGPPGTGKTFVIRALAHESGAAFFAIKGAELLDKFVGESERGVREVFARARSAAPAILFFDEFDALAPIRGRSTTSVTDSVVAALLTEIDGVSARADVVVIGATNRRDLIDPALLRSGRFEVHIELGLPEASARRALLNISDVPFADGIELDELAEKTDGLSFADLTGLLREAALAVLRKGSDQLEVTWAELDEALERFRARTAT